VTTFNRGTLSRCTIYATRTTDLTLQAEVDTPIQLLLSGPMGGDAQLGGLIAEPNYAPWAR
jgi:methylglyoxal synthase